jgi:hypothetical protein
MRRAAIVLAVAMLAGCTHGHAPGIDTGGATAGERQARAEALCRAAAPESAHRAGSFPTTIGDFRRTTIGTVAPTSTARFPTYAATDFGAWCWTGRPGSYRVYEVAYDGRKQLVVSGSVGTPAANDGRPDVP